MHGCSLSDDMPGTPRAAKAAKTASNTAAHRLSQTPATASPKASRAASAKVAKTAKPAAACIEQVDTRYLQSLMGYNARRAALSIIELFLERLAPYGLKPVDFSVMSTIGHNPGVTSRQLCAALNLLPPNLVGLIQSLESRGLIERQPHPAEGPACGPRSIEGSRYGGCARNPPNGSHRTGRSLGFLA